MISRIRRNPVMAQKLWIKRVSAVQANLIAVIEPVFNPIWVFFAIGEAPGIHTLIGGGIIVLAITAASIITARPRE